MNDARDVGAVLVAAGRSSRFGRPGGQPKQYQSVAGVPLLLRALRPFASHPAVAHVVVVLAAEDVAAPPPFLAGLVGGALTLVAGGAERSDSCMAGVAALPAACAVVLVHDAARPFVSRGTIDAVIAEARAGRGALAAVPVADTLKQAAAEAAEATLVGRTVPRDGLWRAQTPQGFPRTLLERAYAEARAAGLAATDDAALVERLGHPVVLVPDSPRNFKVTTPDDLAIAEALAALEGRGA
ncbi:MAG: 2-C-methyl-D-erythritol 4-phosphate cytidylyltransferase [Gemmatimonadales bacterium]|nr:2-C-methyl-D-erythritol 4-phosphate cytidylyltransferase [Gemmatimonadales bacterium]